MSKRPRDAFEREGPPMNRTAGSSGWMGFATLVGVLIVLFINISTWQEARTTKSSLDDRLGKLETRLTQISAKVDAVASKAAAPPQRGPDPNKVYAVRTDGSPAKGPKEAPVVIAEFSDFQ